MPNRPQERFCLREFKRYLQGCFPSATIRWRGEKRDPPDFWLWCDDHRFAVEVTRILHEENRAVAASQWRLVREAETSARDAGILSGKYVVAFHARLAHGKQKGEIKRRILDFVQQNAKRTIAPLEHIAIGGRLICDISKFDRRNARIFPIGGGAETGGFGGDILVELGELLRRAITTKAEKMRRLKGSAALVLYDLYRLADRAEFRECVRSVPEAGRFAYIYVVQDEGLGFALLSPDTTQ